MSRWTIEKDGTGIEKSGTGIEKSGTGIEKSGTGIRRSLLALSMASIAFASQISANQLEPEGNLSLVVQNDTILASWIIDGSIFSGVSSLEGTAINLSLTEITLAQPRSPGGGTEVTGGGTGIEVTGGGTGLEVTGGGTGIEVTGGGTGIEVTGGGTGIEVTGGGTGIEVTGGGTGIEVTGGGTGIEVTGGGTGIEVTGGGTGIERIAITLPTFTGLEMEVTLGCETASVSIIDSNFIEVARFNNVQVVGITGLCQSNARAITPRFGSASHPGKWNKN